VRSITTDEPAPLPTHFSQPLRAFVTSLLKKDPRKRPSAMQALDMPFLRAHLDKYLNALVPAGLDADARSEASAASEPPARAGAGICAACHLSIAKGGGVDVDKDLFHPSCFACKNCKVPLPPADPDAFVKNARGQWCQRSFVWDLCMYGANESSLCFRVRAASELETAVFVWPGAARWALRASGRATRGATPTPRGPPDPR
jgi:hypothetical protein